MHRSAFPISLIFLGLLLGCSSPKDDPPPPNVLFILVDDLGVTDLSCLGSSYYETPNIDRIAKEGMVFTQGYAGSRVCSPSRATIMTGQFAARHGITDWIGARTGEDWRKANRHDLLLPAGYTPHLPYDNVVLPEAMLKNGYKTFYSGKWHLGSEGSYPEDHGFQINKGGWEKGSPIGGFFSPWTNPKLPNLRDGENLSMRLADETVKFITENKDSSFFAFLSFYAVHGPIQTTKEKWDKYRVKALEGGVADSGFEMERVLPIRRQQDNPVYAGLVEAMDDAVGRVLNCLDELGLEENTIVIFTSDNGGVASGDAFSTTNLPFRGGKGYQWEGGIREPYFIKVPWLEHNGAESAVPVTGADFYPTILDLAGISLKPEEHVDGVSLLPLLNGETIPERTLYWHYPHYGNQGGNPSSIIREENWKLIHYWEDGSDELYNLASDIGEENDLAAEQPEKTQALKEKLLAWLEQVNARYPTPDPEYDAQLDRERDERIRTQLWPDLEQRRRDFLRADWSPNENWWDSAVTKD